MSTPRSGSPRYRRFPWEEPGFDPEKVVAELDGNPPEGGRRFREDPEERVESLGGRNMYPEGQRRSGSGSGPFLDGHPEFYHGRRDDHRLPPLDAERRGGGSSRERFRKFGSRETLSRSPSRGRRDGSRTHSDHQEPRSGWWREDQDQDPGLDPGPGLGPGPGPRGSCSPISAHHQADGPPGRARLRQNPHQDRTPPFKRPRREPEDTEHLGSLCYSSDRQLSLDLVNVGRRRLDFLPLLEPSGQEPAVHSGTFAQEVISLVHQVKEQYFRGDGVTLNERFSAPPPLDPGPPEEELTLHQRFGSGRGFSLDLDLDLDQDPDLDEEPLFSRLGPVQPPGDLRHDLERRRQQKLEGVKVTIAGGRNPGPNR